MGHNTKGRITVTRKRDYDRHYRLRPIARFGDYKKDAKARGITFELTFEEFVRLINSPCHYCGSEPTRRTIGVDRRNNEPYYRWDNALPCCQACNFAKGRMTEKEFFALSEQVAAEGN